MIKEIKYGGYTATPSDYECPDGDLAGVVNMVPEEGALKPVLPPAGLFTLTDGYKVWCLHHVTMPQDNYIIYDETAKKLYYLNKSLVDNANPKPLQWEDTEATGSPYNDVKHNLKLIKDFSPAVVTDVEPVGNTLVVLATDGIHYILWGSGNDYMYLGQKIPELKIQFGLDVEMTCYPKDKQIGEGETEHADRSEMSGFISGSENVLPFWDNGWAEVQPKDFEGTVPETWRDSWTFSLEGVEGLPTMSSVIGRWTNYAMGNVNKMVSEAQKEHKFTSPFFVRWAYELYDGSYVMHSDPVLMIPNSKYPFFALDTGNRGFRFKDVDNDNRDFHFGGRAYGFAGTLMAHITNNDNLATITALTTNWKDVLKGITIFTSAPIYTYDQDGKVYGWTNMDDNGAWNDFYTVGKTTVTGHTSYGQHSFEDIFKPWNAASAPLDETKRYWVSSQHSDAPEHLMPDYILTMPEKKKEDILLSVESPSFYKIASYKLDDADLVQMSGANPQAVNIKDGVLESLVARETMKDDYHSRDLIKAERSFAYNGRVNLSGITRTLHSPLSPDIAWAKDDHLGTHRSWTITVEYKDGGSTRVVESVSGQNDCAFPRYIFYADRNAKNAWVKYTSSGTTHKWSLPLTEHPHLEGAYWYGGLEAVISETEYTGTIPNVSNAPVEEANKVYTSEINNPFVFPLLGINTVGTGTILGICAATRALSQGQFGQFPLYAFTSEGVWALQTTSSGGYSAVQPVTRDVCINAESITQTDTEVLFATDRGIMMISGSQTVCVSESLDSRDAFDITTLPSYAALLTLGNVSSGDVNYGDFHEFIKGCRIIYDYVHQRYIVFNPEYDSVLNAYKYSYAYIYSLKSNKWGVRSGTFLSGVNSYPDALAINTSNTVVDLSEDGATTGVKGMIITRPLKLDPADALKTVDTIIQRGYFDYADTTRSVKPVRQVLYGSRDLFHWHQIWSSQDQYLRGFSGTPYKYFRLALLCDLKDGESLYGCTVRYEPRLTDQPR